MPKYLTVAQYKQYADYPLTAKHTNLVLARTITRAESAIDAFMGFDLQSGGGFEPHTGWVEFRWNSKTRKTRIPDFPVPLRRALSYSIQAGTQQGDGSPFSAPINPNDLAYQVFERYIEVLAMETLLEGMAPVILQYGANPPIVQLDYESGFYLPVWKEPLITEDRQTYYAEHGFWAEAYTQALSIRPQRLPAIPPVVYINNVVVDSSAYAINSVEGMVAFTVQRAESDVVTLDYCYTIPAQVHIACVEQVTHILKQKALTDLGLGGLNMIRSGEQQLQRSSGSSSSSSDTETGTLCKEAAKYLQGYKQTVGIA